MDDLEMPMLTQSDARIYLASLRGYSEKGGLRSFRTFNFEEYQVPEREPHGKFLAFNDEMLEPGKSCEIEAEAGVQIVLLPLAGGIELKEGSLEEKYVSPGEVIFLSSLSPARFQVTNPYAESTINFLQIRLTQVNSEETVASFSLGDANILVDIEKKVNTGLQLSIGRYQGREEGNMVNLDPHKSVFVFIIEGAFEVQNRLLERRDGLMLSGFQEIEFEALSNEAVILLIAGI